LEPTGLSGFLRNFKDMLESFRTSEDFLKLIDLSGYTIYISMSFRDFLKLTGLSGYSGISRPSQNFFGLFRTFRTLYSNQDILVHYGCSFDGSRLFENYRLLRKFYVFSGFFSDFPDILELLRTFRTFCTS
jgi:hypothetical protein